MCNSCAQDPLWGHRAETHPKKHIATSIRGYRAWCLHNNDLAPMVQSDYESGAPYVLSPGGPRILRAECSTLLHKAPKWVCRCGIYVLGRLEDVVDQAPIHQYSGTVLGVVDAAGHIINHDEGFRAEKVYVQALWAPTHKMRKQLHKDYPDIPVYSSLVKMAAQWPHDPERRVRTPEPVSLEAIDRECGCTGLPATVLLVLNTLAAFVIAGLLLLPVLLIGAPLPYILGATVVSGVVGGLLAGLKNPVECLTRLFSKKESRYGL